MSQATDISCREGTTVGCVEKPWGWGGGRGHGGPQLGDHRRRSGRTREASHHYWLCESR